MSRMLFLTLVIGLLIGLATAVSGAPATVGQPFVLKEKLLASDPPGLRRICRRTGAQSRRTDHGCWCAAPDGGWQR